MKKNIVLITVLALISACKNDTTDIMERSIPEEIITEKPFKTIKELQWLVGTWTNHTKEKQSYENWIQVNDSTLRAHSFTIVENDTVFAERVTLQQKKSNTYFTVIAYNQNDNKPVTFKMIPSEKKTFTFENPQHDFPSRISYTNPVKDSIHAWIEGTVKGENRKVDFYFKRN